jgi:hypothetical protein
VLPHGHTHFEEFKKNANTVLEGKHEQRPYNEVQALLFTWKKNDLGLKAPDKKDSVIIDETVCLKGVFIEDWGFQAKHHEFGSGEPQREVDMLLSDLDFELSDKNSANKKVLLIIYYNGHGTIFNHNLIWSAYAHRESCPDNTY